MTEMDQGCRLWLYKHARRNYWRVAAWYDFDDLIQDGMLCYQRVVAKYERRQYVTEGGKVTNKSPRVRSRPHLQRLFQRAFSNHLHDLAKSRTGHLVEERIRDISTTGNMLPEELVWDYTAPTIDILAHEHVVAEAPAMLQRLLATLLDEGELKRIRSQYRVRSDGTRETLNDRLCSIVKVDPSKFDIATALRNYLRSELSAA